MTGNAFTSATSLGASSVQDYGTPPEFIAAVERAFGPLVLDLAAHERNHVCADWLGPGGLCPDSLVAPWHEADGLLWLNPPFAETKRWAKKCAEEAQLGARIAMLAPANIGAAWFWRDVNPFAHVYALDPRIAFVGAPWRAWHKSFPKGSIAVPAHLQSEGAIRAWLTCQRGAEAGERARVARLPFPGALMLALYGTEAERIERWTWQPKPSRARRDGR